MKLSKSKVHFIGVGGIGMCGLAELLHNMGASVSGSDLSENQQTRNLQSMGIKVFKGHAKSNVLGADVVVFSSAVKPENVEYAEAIKRKIPLIPRAEALAEMMRLKRGIAIAGSHGKTTTTSLTATLFLQAQLDPTIVVGGRLDVIKSTAKLGSGEWLIAEADESDGSFNRLAPEIVVITNIDDDHLDYYKSFENIQKAFLEFANRVPFYGQAIVCGDDPQVRRLFSSYAKQVVFYGWDESNDVYLKQERGLYKIFESQKEVGAFSTSLPGKHNATNALAALLVGRAAGVEWSVLLGGLKTFAGVDRRMTLKDHVKDVMVYDDYAHHPTEVSAVLSALKDQYPGKTLAVLFQPHRYSRTQFCWDRFLTCFGDCDLLYLLDIYPAGEAPIAEVTGTRFFESVQHPKKFYCQNLQEAESKLLEDLSPNTVFVTLGAGDVWKVAETLGKKLGEKV